VEIQKNNLISVTEACALIKDFKLPLRGLARPILADRDYPPIDRVTLDGIAISHQSFSEGCREFKIEDVAAAGIAEKTLSHPHNCIEVMTGAPLPKNTNLVIPYEHLSINHGTARIVKNLERNIFENIHLKASDVKKSDQVLAAGTKLLGPQMGIAASVGAINHLETPQPKILLIATGDELVNPYTNELLDHQLRASNIYALKTSLENFGYTNIEMTTLPDHEKTLREHFTTHVDRYDYMIYSGGVSKGQFDYLPTVWKSLGCREIFHGVSQRPGKPLWFGVNTQTTGRHTVVVGLPGNPISGLVCLHRYLLPNKNIYAQLTTYFNFNADMTYFLPVKIEFSSSAILMAHPVKTKNSGDFTALASSDGFIELPLEKNEFKKGEAYRFYSWSAW
jgi:molybdopterin molybdotransferase